MSIPITVPVAIQTTDTTIPVSTSDNSDNIALNIDHVTAPIQIDFTAEAETLAPGSEATVEYQNKHFTFGIPKGVKGDQGEQGERGLQGEKGDKGDKGDTGATGAKGDKGDKGDQGIQGVQGERGEQGIQGVQGVQGEQGIQGEQGVPGKDGKDGTDGFSPIATVSKSGTTATISVTDKNGTTTATVSDGTTPDMSAYRTSADQDLIDNTLLPKTGTVIGMLMPSPHQTDSSANQSC